MSKITPDGHFHSTSICTAFKKKQKQKKTNKQTKFFSLRLAASID